MLSKHTHRPPRTHHKAKFGVRQARHISANPDLHKPQLCSGHPYSVPILPPWHMLGGFTNGLPDGIPHPKACHLQACHTLRSCSLTEHCAHRGTRCVYSCFISPFCTRRGGGRSPEATNCHDALAGGGATRKGLPRGEWRMGRGGELSVHPLACLLCVWHMEGLAIRSWISRRAICQGGCTERRLTSRRVATGHKRPQNRRDHANDRSRPRQRQAVAGHKRPWPIVGNANDRSRPIPNGCEPTFGATAV